MAVHTLQVTLGGGTRTQVTATDTPVRQVMFQNNAAHNIRVGDINTTSSRGALLASGSPGGAINAGGFQFQQTNLNEWYIAGTAADVIDVVYID